MNEGQDIQGQDFEGQASESTNASASSEDAATAKKPRGKRASVKSVENRVAAIEQRVETFAEELAQLSRMTEQLNLGGQLAHLSGRIAKLEETMQARAGDDAAAVSPRRRNHRPGASARRALAEACQCARAASLESRLRQRFAAGTGPTARSAAPCVIAPDATPGRYARRQSLPRSQHLGQMARLDLVARPISPPPICIRHPQSFDTTVRRRSRGCASFCRPASRPRCAGT